MFLVEDLKIEILDEFSARKVDIVPKSVGSPMGSQRAADDTEYEEESTEMDQGSTCLTTEEKTYLEYIEYPFEKESGLKFMSDPLLYFIIFTLKIEKTRRLIFVTFSELEKSVTKMRNVTKVSVTKMSGDSIYNNFEVLTRGFN